MGDGARHDQLRRKHLVAPTHGVRARRIDDRGWTTLVEAVALTLRPDQYLSHTTALRLWRCPLPRRVQSEDVVHVTTIGGGPVMRRREVVGHRIAADRTLVSELMTPRASAPEFAWYECRSLLGLRELVVVGDHLVGASGLATIAELRATIQIGDRGVRCARAAADLVRVGSESPMETVMRLIVVEAGFPEPACNVDVVDSAGRFIGRADMAWVDLRIAIEYDGDHHRDRDTFRHDARRRNGFVVNGWIALHVTAADASDPAQFLVRLAEAFARRRSTPR